MRGLRRSVSIFAAGTLVASGVAFSASPASAASVFFTTAGTHDFVVPNGVTEIHVSAWGAQGGSSHAEAWSTDTTTVSSTAPGGGGARAESTISVTPGETLHVHVGGEGGNGAAVANATTSSSAGGSGGVNGGGAGDGGTGSGGPTTNGELAKAAAGAGGGGGASDVRQGGDTPANRVIVAAGGGGGAAGGAGARALDGGTNSAAVVNGGIGGNSGGGGGNGSGSSPGTGGDAGTAVAGGLGGVESGEPGDTDGAGTGGDGSFKSGGGGSAISQGAIATGGGGGGGGFHGGGGGGVTSLGVVDAANFGASGGGGGGSSLGDTVIDNTNVGDGSVTITYEEFVRPDAMVRALPSGSFAGDGIYNLDGAGQGASKLVKPGKTVKFVVRIQNDGSDTDEFRIVANTTQKKFSARYFIGGSEITLPVAFGTAVTGPVPPDDHVDVTVRVSASANAKPSQSFEGALSTNSRADPLIADTVRYVATAK